MEIVKYAYDRWINLPYEDVLDEMAILFHLAVQIEEVIKRTECLNTAK